uniref:Uncharacterized protein n=1 Tax=Ananas comosus var. bracteatus TaxID=296719 RepID=A0A6V7QHI2_ANACO|nr:unnamed protein product [Ananas comosus var. bracteatus]
MDRLVPESSLCEQRLSASLYAYEDWSVPPGTGPRELSSQDLAKFSSFSQVTDRRAVGDRLRVRAEPGNKCHGRPIASVNKQSESVTRWVVLTEDISSLPCRSGMRFYY